MSSLSNLDYSACDLRPEAQVRQPIGPVSAIDPALLHASPQNVYPPPPEGFYPAINPSGRPGYTLYTYLPVQLLGAEQVAYLVNHIGPIYFRDEAYYFDSIARPRLLGGLYCLPVETVNTQAGIYANGNLEGTSEGAQQGLHVARAASTPVDVNHQEPSYQKKLRRNIVLRSIVQLRRDCMLAGLSASGGRAAIQERVYNWCLEHEQWEQILGA